MVIVHSNHFQYHRSLTLVEMISKRQGVKLQLVKKGDTLLTLQGLAAKKFKYLPYQSTFVFFDRSNR